MKLCQLLQSLTPALLQVLGTILIATPDVHHLNKNTQAGKIRHALYELEADSIKPKTDGFDLIMDEIEEITGYSVDRKHPEVYVSTPIFGVRQYKDSGSHRKITTRNSTEDLEEGNPNVWENTDFDIIRKEILEKIRKKEARFRWFGLLLLAAGTLI